MAEEQQKPAVRGITDEEVEILMSGPAVFVNKIYLSSGPTGVRIAFAENRGSDTKSSFRSAIFVPWPDFLSFMEALKQAESNVTIRVSSTIEQTIGGAG